MFLLLLTVTGYGVNRAVHMCNSPENINPENRDRLIKFLSNQMDRLLGYRREYREGMIRSSMGLNASKLLISSLSVTSFEWYTAPLELSSCCFIKFCLSYRVLCILITPLIQNPWISYIKEISRKTIHWPQTSRPLLSTPLNSWFWSFRRYSLELFFSVSTLQNLFL